MAERARRWLAAALAAALLPLLAGCSAENIRLVREFVEDWARAKNIHPTNPDGSLNFGGAMNIATRAAGGSTGDPEADAALDAAYVVKKIKDADELMDRGRQQRDAKAMDQAIAKRPDDLSYRAARQALALEQNDLAAYRRQKEEIQRLGQKRGGVPNRPYYRELYIEELETAHRRTQVYRSREQCQTLHGDLVTAYAERNRPGDQDRATTHTRLREACR